ncbi:MAG: hypothetical protein EVA43_01720 [Flavobacteriales bacterium]|nr:MAG: hypothetical protein EVA43_01720 [Flavobacteriales bacterium]
MNLPKIGVIIIFSCLTMACDFDSNKNTTDFTTVFEKTAGLETATYPEVINFYKQLAADYSSIALYEMGATDSGHPLHLVTFNPNRSFESEFKTDEKQNILLINNGIHPGESDGIDASMMLLRDLAQQKIKTPQQTIIAVIPVYNIGGALNRNSTTRTNQNGPKAYGFRGNARNYDLNRDFIKADSKNSRAFTKIFRKLRPALFIDNHVSNGADYQYTLTHLFTQHNKLGGALGNYLHQTFMPALEDSLAQKNWDIIPYVNVFNSTPDQGFKQFFDSPRYSTGYTTLFNTLGMLVETHMLKPYKKRVEGTYELMKTFIAIAEKEAEQIKKLSRYSQSRYPVGGQYPISWKIDSSKTTELNFKGYTGTIVSSKVTHTNRLKYDRNLPFTKKVAYQNYYLPDKKIRIPESYIVPKGWWRIIELLKLNQIEMIPIKKDTIIEATVYKIENFQTVQNPYEGHYLHYNTQVSSKKERVKVSAGDFRITTQQEGVRYLIETLEPCATDSFFNWNFFDTILQQKEGFSPYVWEDKAFELLENNPALQKEFERKKTKDPLFAKNGYEQLDWLHKQSEHYEKAHLRYPILKISN